MKKTTSITYNIETNEGISTTELEYKDYIKNEKGEENLLHYKLKNITNSEELKAITYAKESRDTSVSENAAVSGDIEDVVSVAGGVSVAIGTSETFNKIYKVNNTIDETVGVSVNNDDWKIHEYKNHKLDKKYKQRYDTIKFDIKNDIFENYEKNNYIKDK
jgi:hypothetical protein